MSKNGYVSALALAALLGLGACGSEGGEQEGMEEFVPPPPSGATEVSPEAVRGRVLMDTTGAGTVVDTTTVPVDTGGAQ